MKAIKYKHLTLEQRSHIEEFVSSGFSLREIGRKLGISASTVCRELKRNSDEGYNHIQAQIISITRRHAASSDFKKLKGKVEKRVLECLQKTWSPEQISGRLKLEGISISHEAIYQYVRKNAYPDVFIRPRPPRKRTQRLLAAFQSVVVLAGFQSVRVWSTKNRA